MRPPVGTALPDTEFRIVEQELWIRSPDLMAGYLHDPQPLNLVDGWLRSGDIAEQRDEFVTLFGRVAERVSIPGLPSAPGLIEDFVDLSRAAGDYAITQVRGQSCLALYTSGPISNEDLDQTIHSGLPIAVIGARQLLRSPSGKVHRTDMAEVAARAISEVESLFAASPADPANIISAAHITGSAAVHEIGPVSNLSCGCFIHTGEEVVTVRVGDSCPVGRGHADPHAEERAIVSVTPGSGAHPTPPPSHEVTQWVQVDAGTFTVVESSAQ